MNTSSDTHLPEGKQLQFVSSDNTYIQAAKEFALSQSLDPAHPTGAVIVKDGKIIGKGANGSSFHEKVGCPRKVLKIKSGSGYWMCPGCSTKNHAEQKAIREAQSLGHNVSGADMYLWGHSYCCRWCWKAMIKTNIENVYLEK